MAGLPDKHGPGIFMGSGDVQRITGPKIKHGEAVGNRYGWFAVPEVLRAFIPL